jgi:hypothetical protein
MRSCLEVQWLLNSQTIPLTSQIINTRAERVQNELIGFIRIIEARVIKWLCFCDPVHVSYRCVLSNKLRYISMRLVAKHYIPDYPG